MSNKEAYAMLRSAIEESSKAWLFFKPLTLLHPYRMLQKRVIEAYSPYANIVERYSKIAKRRVQPLTEDYLKEHPEVAERNITLLRNAIELWNTATRASDAIAPILYHYSWHCFNSFFIYTFFRWEPQHAKSHGVRVILSDNIEDIKIQVLKTGIFRRLIDTWTLIGVSLAFSPFLPLYQRGKLNFMPNDMYLFDQSNELSLMKLLSFNPTDFEKALYSIRRKELLNCPFLINSISLPTQSLKSYLVLFVASSLARYRPVLWHSILTGKTPVQSDFALHSVRAVLDYTIGHEVATTGLLYQIARLFRDIMNGKFVFKSREGVRLKIL